MLHYLDPTGKTLTAINFCDFTDNADDMFLSFGEDKLVMSHIFTVPFKKEDGRLIRFKNWLRALPHWKENFLNRKITNVEVVNEKISGSWNKNFTRQTLSLEFDKVFVLMTNYTLTRVYKGEECCWAGWDSLNYDAKE
jgi:hypothetical protein